MCNSPGARIFEVGVALTAIMAGALMLWRARNGKIRGFYFSGWWVTGKDANYGAGCIAVFLMLLGVFVFCSAVLYLDC